MEDDPHKLRALIRELLEASAGGFPAELRSRAEAAIATKATTSEPDTHHATAARAAIGLRQRRKIMFASLKYRVMNRDMNGTITKEGAAQKIAHEVGASEGVVLELLSRLFPGDEWSRPKRDDEFNSMFDDQGLWLFEVDLPPKRKRKAGNR